MNIFIILKCGFQDSFNFILQIANIKEVEKIAVFRDTVSLNNLKVEYILSKFRKYTILKLISRFFQILRRAKLKPAVIIGIYELPHGLLAVLTGKILRVPVAVSIIGNPAYTKLRKGFRMEVTMWVLRNASFVTVTGSNSKQFLVSKGIPKEKIFVLPNTMDFSKFKMLNNTIKKYDLISLGRISGEKHIEVIVKIISLLKEKMPEIKAAIAGGGPELENIKGLVKRLNLGDNIEILGFIPDEQLQDFFNSGRIFILTSETEGFPRTIIQAAASGVPVIASKVGDISDIIDHEQNGFLINDFQNVEEYSYRILQLLNDSEMYKTFSLNLYTTVRTQFITQKASQVWEEIFNKISGKEKINS
jgi:glycosyltransferase involved in cell wall biosynthesis